MITDYKVLNYGLASTYYITNVRVVYYDNETVVVFTMDTPMIKWHELEVRATMVSPFSILVECIPIGRHSFVVDNDAIDLLEFRLQRIAVNITQTLMFSGELS